MTIKYNHIKQRFMDCYILAPLVCSSLLWPPAGGAGRVQSRIPDC